MKALPFQRALVLAPHTDDEFGCSGTAVRLLQQGSEVFCAAFSTCEESVPAGFPTDVLEKEFRASAAVLGIPSERLTVFHYPVRHFPRMRQEILEELVKLRKQIQPEVVFVPAATDCHQDHQVIQQEGFRCFKASTVLGYELPWNQRDVRHNAFVELSDQMLERKVKALECYESQKFRSYANRDFFRALAKTRGVQSGVAWAEAFECQTLSFRI